MLYKFHITGYAQVDLYRYDNNCTIDITVYSDTEQNALDKAKSVLGYPVARHSRKIIVEEILQEDSAIDTNEIKQQAYREFTEKLADMLLKYNFISDGKYNVYYCSDVKKCIDKILSEGIGE